MHPGSPTPAEAISSAQARIARVAARGGHWLGGYAHLKVSSDWIYVDLCERIPPGATVLDLGSGIGLLGLVLQECKRGCTVHGLEWDGRKVAFGQRLLDPGSSSHLRQGNLLTEPWPEADVVALIDALHYFPPDVQRELLRRISAHLAPGGRLFLRVMDREASGRARLTRLIENAAVALHWNRAAGVHWRSLREIEQDLDACGLSLVDHPTGTHLFDGNRLLAAVKS